MFFSLKNFFFFLFFLSFLEWDSQSNSFFLNFFVYSNFRDFYNFIPSIFFFDGYTFSFLFMVSMVIFLVVLFCSSYMESYDNKKFIFLLLLFCSSMIFLSFSKSFLPLSLGWDLLGVSSIFLIMFYPNKITSYNSFLTFFFNRFSDVLMILCFSLSLGSSLFNFGWLSNTYFLFFLVFCCFVKSAQFPLSPWLPAAMSAPTPVSSLVHSSTLVAAGLLLILTLVPLITISGLFFLSMVVGVLSLFLGGSLALMEKDYKKVIAFSTMSQISVVLVLGLLGLPLLAVSHMLFHAFFKSFLFVMAGFFFLENFSSQLDSNLKNLNFSYWIKSLTFLCVFCMSGLIYSGSFFSKDVFLEFSSSMDSNFFFFFFLFVSGFTVLYCSKILSLFSLNLSSFSVIFFFSPLNLYFFFFSLVVLLESFLIFLKGICPCVFVSKLDSALLIFFFLSISFFLEISMPSKLSILAMDVFFMKSTLFSFFWTLKNLDTFKGIESDEFFFKKNIVFLKNLTISASKTCWVLSIIFLMFFSPIL